METMNESNYFIKASYKPNSTIETIETEYRKYWTIHRISQSYYSQYYVYKFCRKLVKEEKLKSVLDIGCGTGIKLMKLIYPVCDEVYGIDQQGIIQYCRKMYGLETFLADDIENPTLSLKKKFDLIICADVIEHILNPDNLLSYIRKFCHNNTYIVISTPERDILRGRECDFSPKKTHIREWNIKEFRHYLESRKFNILCHKLIKSFKILITLNNSVSNLKKDFITQLYKFSRFRSLKLLKHSQLVLLKTNHSKALSWEISDFPKSIVFIEKLANHFIIGLHYFLFKVYTSLKKIHYKKI